MIADNKSGNMVGISLRKQRMEFGLSQILTDGMIIKLKEEIL